MDPQVVVLEWYKNTVRFLPNLVLIMIMLLLTIVVSRRSQRLVYQLSARTQAPREISELLGRMARIGVLLIGMLVVLGRLGLGSAVLSFVAGLGVAGIVIGFALQDIVKHFAAGVLLLMLRPFRIGDEVRIGDYVGLIKDVQLRATVLRTENGDEVLIPNADVYNSAIVNLSRYDLRRQAVALKIARSLDWDRARATLAQAIERVPGVAADPPPAVVATGLDDTTLTVDLRFWVDRRATDAAHVTTEVIAAARQALEQARAPAPNDAQA
jgi:small-conductance mechanosensitive channel